MKPFVLPYEELDVAAVRVKKPLACGPAFATFNLSYGKANRKLLLQSPSFVVMREPFVERRANGTERLALCVGGGDRGRGRREEFLGRLGALEDCVLARVTQAYPETFDGKTRSGCCRPRRPPQESVIGGDVEARFRNQRAAIHVFDASGKETATDTLTRGQEVAMLLEVAHVWAGSTHYGVDIRPVQVMRVDVDLPSSCSLLPRPPPPKPSPDPPSDKYAKMLKMGIPQQAVEHAMVMDGAKPPPSAPPRRPPPPPPPPPPPKVGAIARGGGDPMGAVLSQISGGQFKLRAVEDPSPRPPPQQQQHWTRRLVPSLADILGAKNRLRNAFSRTSTSTTSTRTYEPHNTFPFLEDIREGRFSLRKRATTAT